MLASDYDIAIHSKIKSPDNFPDLFVACAVLHPWLPVNIYGYVGAFPPFMGLLPT